MSVVTAMKDAVEAMALASLTLSPNGRAPIRVRVRSVPGEPDNGVRGRLIGVMDHPAKDRSDGAGVPDFGYPSASPDAWQSFVEWMRRHIAERGYDVDALELAVDNERVSFAQIPAKEAMTYSYIASFRIV